LTPRSLKEVPELTSTVQVESKCFRPSRVKLPEAPEVPQLPEVLDPSTDSTAPEARGVSIRTFMALTVLLELVGPAPARSPKQRLAKVADPTPA
jgi:hypothetical protein